MQLPIVGARFRPPAEDVLNMLPADTPLILRRQPDNPYDENAVQVLFDYEACGFEDLINSLCEETSASVDSPMHLGYIPRGEAETIAPQMDEQIEYIKDSDDVVIDQKVADVPAKLAFSMTGKPEVFFTLEFPK